MINFSLCRYRLLSEYLFQTHIFDRGTIVMSTITELFTIYQMTLILVDNFYMVSPRDFSPRIVFKY